MHTVRHNARYRGPIKSEDINMLQLEVIADISELCNQVNGLASPSDILGGSLTPTVVYSPDEGEIYSGPLQSISTLMSNISSMTYPVKYNCLGGL